MVLIFKNFLSTDECNQLNDWADLGVKNKWLDSGCDVNSMWDYKNRVTSRAYADRFEYSPEIYKVQTKITNFLQLEDLEKSVAGQGKDGIVVNCIFDGGNLFAHKDHREGKDKELEVLRCNVMTRKPEFGGHLYVDDKKIDLDAGDLHCYLPSMLSHYATEVKGQISRVLWMFGYQCSIERFNKICLNQKQT